jgi:hypothetical protein
VIKRISHGLQFDMIYNAQGCRKHTTHFNIKLYHIRLQQWRIFLSHITLLHVYVIFWPNTFHSVTLLPDILSTNYVKLTFVYDIMISMQRKNIYCGLLRNHPMNDIHAIK